MRVHPPGTSQTTDVIVLRNLHGCLRCGPHGEFNAVYRLMTIDEQPAHDIARRLWRSALFNLLLNLLAYCVVLTYQTAYVRKVHYAEVLVTLLVDLSIPIMGYYGLKVLPSVACSVVPRLK